MARATSKLKQAIIPNGASTSNEIDLSDALWVGLIIPAIWTAAAISFDVSAVAGGPYNHLYDDAGAEVSVAQANVLANRAISLRSNSGIGQSLLQWPYIVIR